MKTKIPGATRITDNFSRKSVDKIRTWWWDTLNLSNCFFAALETYNYFNIQIAFPTLFAREKRC